MTRRQFSNAFAVSLGLGPALCDAAIEPNWASLGQHQVPDWYQNAKLGIFIHWGLYSVPCWATPSGEYGQVPKDQWFARNPYAEWYLNTLRIKDSPTYQHHVKTYGANFDYYQFSKDFNRGTARWDPASWAHLFRKTGARYVVLTTKHHDGFRLWPSSVPNPRRPAADVNASRDLVGDLSAAVRSAGMKMGLYYSGGLDWTFTQKPIETMAELRERVPQTEEYARYADAHWTELTDRYRPAVMWNDISYPKAGKIPELFAHYYNTVSDGVINNRFGVDFADITTPEYAKYDKITPKKWESCRGLGYSFGYNQVEGPEQVIASDKLIWLLTDIVSKNGNLLLNVGPKSDGSIADIQIDRLNHLGNWLAVNGEGIFDSKPWIRAAPDGSDGDGVRFTRKQGSLYVFLRDSPSSTELVIPGVHAATNASIRILGSNTDSKWRQQDSGIAVSVVHKPAGNFPLGVRITPEPEAA